MMIIGIRRYVKLQGRNSRKLELNVQLEYIHYCYGNCSIYLYNDCSFRVNGAHFHHGNLFG